MKSSKRSGGKSGGASFFFMGGRLLLIWVKSKTWVSVSIRFPCNSFVCHSYVFFF